MENLPNLIIAGVNKAGTTSLFSYLSAHRQVCPSSIKETCYFLPLRYGEPLAPLEDYSDLFAHSTGQKYVMEATPGYFYGGRRVAEEIRERLGNPKILFLFRNPADRAFSFFRSLKGKTVLPPDMTFSAYIETCERRLSDSDLFDRRGDHFYRGLLDGFYADHLPDWYDCFGDSVRVLFFEHLKADPLRFMKDVCQWLGIDDDVYESSEFAVENRTVYYKYKSLHQSAIAVNKFFEKHLRRHPKLKQAMRRVYFKFNESRNGEVMLDAEREHLDSLYGARNRRLHSLLLEKGYTEFPEWLSTR